MLNAYLPHTVFAGAVMLAVGTGLMLFRRVRLRAAPALAAVVAMGVGILLHERAYHRVPADHVALFADQERSLARLTGRIADRPQIVERPFPPFDSWLPDRARTSFLLNVEQIDTAQGQRTARGLARVSIAGATTAFAEGARVEVFGWLQRPAQPRNPGSLDWATIQARRGIRAAVYCDNPGVVRILAPASEVSWWSLVAWRDRVSRLLVGEPADDNNAHAAFLDTMILGRRSGLDPAIEDAFVRTGCAHFLAVSGINVVLLAMAVWLPAQWLGATRRGTVALVLVAVAAYTLIADPRPPILRAAVMTAAYCLTVVLRRPSAVLNALCLSAIVLLLIDPNWLFDVGFQLSFLAVLGIVYITPPLLRAAENTWFALATGLPGQAPVSREILELQRRIMRSRPRRWWHRIGSHITMAIVVSVAAWFATLPIVASTFGRVPLAGWLNSAIAALPVTVVMVLGTIKIPIVFVLPFLDAPLSALLHGASRILLVLMSALAAVPHETLRLPPPPISLTVAFYAFLLFSLRRQPPRVPRYVTPALAVALAGLTALWWFDRPLPQGVLVTQLAVGRGTSTVIETTDGGVWLYDAGASGSYDPGRNTILPYLQTRKIRRIDGIIISHANLDHFGGVPALLETLPCDAVYLCPQFDRYATSDTPARALLTVLERGGAKTVAVARGDVLDLGGGAKASVLWPDRDLPLTATVNDSSLVIRLEFAGRSILLTGDIGPTPEARLANEADARCDALVLPHHGAVGPITARLVEAVAARHIIRSTFDRDAESPALTRLLAGRTLLNTAEVGAVQVLLAADGVVMAPALPSYQPNPAGAVSAAP
jgi:competence protein ComEC